MLLLRALKNCKGRTRRLPGKSERAYQFKTSIYQRHDRTTQEVVNITKSLKFTQEELHDSLANVKDGIKQVQADLWEIKDDDFEHVMIQLMEVENRSRRNNFLIKGIA